MAGTTLHCADPGEAADLAAFLGRLIHYDKAAAVRLQGSGDALAVFGRPASFEVLAIRTVRLAGAGSGTGVRSRPGSVSDNGQETDSGPAPTLDVDVTVSAGELLESIDEAAGTATVPAAVTGPPWAGLLPPRGGWRLEPALLVPGAVRAAVSAAVAEFKARMERLSPPGRTRAELDRIGREIWSRTVGDTGLPMRAAHAAQSLGFLRPARPATAPVSASVSAPTPSEEQAQQDGALALYSSGPWLRLRTPYGSIAVRRTGLGGLGVTPR
ncbi:hypothetical protein [Streptomyces tsukubensis]|uniref:Uncharacterized protein n=1 Tax=Streptomyces tsukubensis TaxID=83656 RepID=A0A1V4AAA2_9ACTN|nr:hypothetical protein [Streptomyces tsukubensis]OON80745.1 hypothetical protein B1H18_10065 [Streptomyces tsukubensis]QFR97674.1 hypothetical protein GBW32_11605 [Streptomyces tsukubensis]